MTVGGDTEGCGFKLLQHFKDKLFPSECVLMILDAEAAVFFLRNFSHKATAADFVLTPLVDDSALLNI